MNKRFRILLIMIANVIVTFAQTVFSVEEISETEYFKAEKDCSYYNVFSSDSIIDNEIVNLVLKESRAKFERLESVLLPNMLGIEKVEDIVFDKQDLLYYPELKLYGFSIPTSPFDISIWWFDSESGKYICQAAYPTAINTAGVYVSQVGHDCDWPLELNFFHRDGTAFYNFLSYKTIKYSGEPIYVQIEDTDPKPIFWYDNNTLFLATYDYEKQKSVYLKIKIQ